MRSRLIIDGNAVYEVDEDCMRKKQTDKSSGKDIFENERKKQIKRGKIPGREKKRG